MSADDSAADSADALRSQGVITIDPLADMTEEQRDKAYQSLMFVGGGMQNLCNVTRNPEWEYEDEEQEDEVDENYISPDLLIRARQELESLKIQAAGLSVQSEPAVSGCAPPTLLEKARNQCTKIQDEVAALEKQELLEQKEELLAQMESSQQQKDKELEDEKAKHRAKVEARLKLRRQSKAA